MSAVVWILERYHFWLLWALLFSKKSSYRVSQRYQMLLSVAIHSFAWLETSSVGYCNISPLWVSLGQVHFFPTPVLAMAPYLLRELYRFSWFNCVLYSHSSQICNSETCISFKIYPKFLKLNLEGLLFPWARYIENRDLVFILLTFLSLSKAPTVIC